jgi:2,3-diketo-5-methylthio-1-phosphopentane phosphatase
MEEGAGVDDAAGRERLYDIHIFCDFDGTISGLDIGYDLFDRFGAQEPWNTQLLEGKLDVREYWRIMAEQLREPLTDNLLDDYLRSIPLDPGFGELLELARSEGIPFTIVSDGFDLYIDRFLSLHGVADVEVYCNHAELTGSGRLEVSFPHAAEGCDCICATCKRNVLLWRAPPEERIIYIGDGVSDYCPAEHADIIFAKKSLAAYCNRQRLPHYPFKTLSDVARQLRLLLSRRRIRPRYQAQLRRRGVWEGE